MVSNFKNSRDFNSSCKNIHILIKRISKWRSIASYTRKLKIFFSQKRFRTTLVYSEMELNAVKLT